jgi:hypothetical protein
MLKERTGIAALSLARDVTSVGMVAPITRRANIPIDGGWTAQ